MLAVVLTAGCSGASNAGGRTTCDDFLAMSNDNKDATVARMLKERNGSNSSTSAVIDERLSVIARCESAGDRGVRIGDLG